MNRIAFADKTGRFAWSDAHGCNNIPNLTRRVVAKQFTVLVFSKFHIEADSHNGIMTGATCAVMCCAATKEIALKMLKRA